jgi:DNA-binding response OmpR family regulator
LLTSYFESKGYKCKGVVSGTKGLEELRGGIPKLILLDIILPDISGYEICRMIKNDKKYNDVPVYLLTAIPGSEVEKKMSETKADGYILKPFDFSDFEVVFHYL